MKKAAIALVCALGVLFVIGLLSPRQPETAVASAVASGVPAEKPAAKLKVTVRSATYEHGYFKTVGVVENVGTAAAARPRINLTVFDPSRTTLATDTSVPAGTLTEPLPVGSSAAFEHITRVPGEPSRVTWSVEIGSKHQGEVIMPKGAKPTK